MLSSGSTALRSRCRLPGTSRRRSIARNRARSNGRCRSIRWTWDSPRQGRPPRSTSEYLDRSIWWCRMVSLRMGSSLPVRSRSQSDRRCFHQDNTERLTGYSICCCRRVLLQKHSSRQENSHYSEDSRRLEYLGRVLWLMLISSPTKEANRVLRTVARVVALFRLSTKEIQLAAKCHGRIRAESRHKIRELLQVASIEAVTQLGQGLSTVSHTFLHKSN